jgi:hypothetical protein
MSISKRYAPSTRDMERLKEIGNIANDSKAIVKDWLISGKGAMRSETPVIYSAFDIIRKEYAKEFASILDKSGSKIVTELKVAAIRLSDARPGGVGIEESKVVKKLSDLGILDTSLGLLNYGMTEFGRMVEMELRKLKIERTLRNEPVNVTSQPLARS